MLFSSVQLMPLFDFPPDVHIGFVKNFATLSLSLLRDIENISKSTQTPAKSSCIFRGNLLKLQF